MDLECLWIPPTLMFISADQAHYAFKVIKMFSFIASLDLKPLSAHVIFFKFLTSIRWRHSHLLRCFTSWEYLFINQRIKEKKNLLTNVSSFFVLVCEALLKIVLEKQLDCARKSMCDFVWMNILKSTADQKCLTMASMCQKPKYILDSTIKIFLAGQER